MQERTRASFGLQVQLSDNRDIPDSQRIGARPSASGVPLNGHKRRTSCSVTGYHRKLEKTNAFIDPALLELSDEINVGDFNYRFCSEFILDRSAGSTAKVLDYGCGSGRIVSFLRNQKIDAYGCDVFSQGGDYSSQVDPALLSGNYVRRMNGDEIPFDNETFDFVVSNQVLEHVVDLDRVVSEMHRVLKPGGISVNLFPDKSVWREGHCHVMFLHWFPKQSRPRVYYAAACAALGGGVHKANKSPMQWSSDICDWLDRWTHYRPYRSIADSFNTRFQQIEHLEDYWLLKRVEGCGPVAMLPASVRRLIVRKFSGLVLTATRTV